MTQTPTTITTSGGLLTAAFIDAVREPGTRLRGLEPETFSAPGSAPRTPADVEAAVATAWELLLERWDAVREELHRMDVSQVRARWLLPLCQVLDFEPVYLRSDTLVGGDEKLRFPLSHRGWEGEGAPVLHLVTAGQELDSRMAAAGAGQGFKAKSPHDMLQTFLNVSRADTWAVLSNGLFLRLLRTYHHTFTKGYVQFDLEAIFETRNYADFRALYRLCHASRFRSSAIPQEDEKTACPLEWFYQDALATGVKVGEGLREQVRQAIETLGNGFLDADLLRTLTRHAPNVKREDLTDDVLRLTDDASRLTRDYYAEILHIIYRILFLLFAEQRGMLPHAGAPLADLYRREYSITALRSRAEGELPAGTAYAGEAGHAAFSDLWEGLKVTFRMVSEGAPELGVFGYDGMLFADGQTPLIDDTARANHAVHGIADTGETGAQGPPLSNAALLHAIRALTLIERDGVLQRISYADLGVEELGSIYESLLDFTPRVTTVPEVIEGREVPAHTFILDPRGQERKTTGSYYTHPSLVQQLLETALLPVVKEAVGSTLAPKKHPEARPATIEYAALTPKQRLDAEAALLALKVCDPAVGSGHFLVKANNVLAAELARVRTGDEYPPEAALQTARRDVLAHCIYAVDLNPMAVELCKVSLWINASVRDAPLNFLDHHIRCGNSLVGMPVRSPQPGSDDPFADGLPEGAFVLNRAGDDPAAAKRIRDRHRQECREFERAGAVQLGLFQVTRVFEPVRNSRRWAELERLAATAPQAARDRFEAYQADEKTARAKLIADAWTAAFFWPLTPDAPPPPTGTTFRELLALGKKALSEEQQQMVAALAEKHRFFHWQLAFPDVFTTPSSPRGEKEVGGAGFDVVLGNPPWERIKLQEKEFFADKDPAVAGARTAAERGRAIKALARQNPALHRAYVEALHDGEALGDFLRESRRYPLSAAGDLNTYQLFAGLVRQLVGGRGRVGVILPTGIATDFYNQEYFSTLVGDGALASLYDFENRSKLFPEVDSRFKFSLVTLTGPEAPAEAADYAFFLHRVDDLADPERHFALTAADLRRINPNTGTCPIFRTRRDAELTTKLYRAAPVLVNEATGENPWEVSYLRMFDMANDSGLFRTREQLEAEGYELDGNRFVSEDGVYLPLYEGRMIHHFDHRATSVGINTETRFRSGVSIDTTAEEHADPGFMTLPRYWVEGTEVSRVMSEHERNWIFVFKDISSATNERTFIGTIAPLVAVGHTAPLMLPNQVNTIQTCGLIANLSTFTFDFAVRQKMGGVHLTYFILQQLPILLPETYMQPLTSHVSRITFPVSRLPDFIVPRVLELTYTAWDLRPFADDVWAEADAGLRERLRAQWEAQGHGAAALAGDGFPYPPFTWDEERRAHLRAELDALYAHLYGLTREELETILETFPIVKRRDEAQWGEYRTKRLVVEAFEALGQ